MRKRALEQRPRLDKRSVGRLWSTGIDELRKVADRKWLQLVEDRAKWCKLDEAHVKQCIRIL